MSSYLPVVIDDLTPLSHVAPPPGLSTGLELPAELQGRRYEGVAEPFPDALLIPRSEWKDRIEDRVRTRRVVKDRLLAGKVRVKDQAKTNYCWINAPTFAAEVVRFVQGERAVVLSPASGGAVIKKFRNVGGWGREALEFIAERGLVPAENWPANAIDRSYSTPENDALRPLYRVDEWWELEPQNLDQLVSCLLRGFPVAVGFNWWGHEVLAVDPVIHEGEIAIQIANSWSENWGDRGFGILKGRRMLPDDAVAPRSAVPS